MNKRMRYKGYEGTVEYCEESKMYFGTVQGLKKASMLYEGKTIELLRTDFHEMVEEYFDTCKEYGWLPETPSKELPLLPETTRSTTATRRLHS